MHISWHAGRPLAPSPHPPPPPPPAGLMAMTLCVCLSVCAFEQNISKSIQLINFIFAGCLPSDPVNKWSDFEKDRSGVREGLGVGVESEFLAQW